MTEIQQSSEFERFSWTALLVSLSLFASPIAGSATVRPLTPPVAPKYHNTVHASFEKIIAKGRHSTVKVVCGGRLVGLGTVVHPGGYYLTKASTLNGKVHCLTLDGIPHKSPAVALWPAYDLMLLKASTLDLPPIEWDTKLPEVGCWIAAPRQINQWVSVGIISRSSSPIAYSLGSLGIVLNETAARIGCRRILSGSQAERVGLRSGDQFTHIGNSKIRDASELHRAMGLLLPGQTLSIRVERLERPIPLAFSIPANGILPNGVKSPYVSQRRFGFAQAIEHDGVLSPNDCGGPLVGLSGRAVGINIARASRASSYAISARAVAKILEQYEFPAASDRK